MAVWVAVGVVLLNAALILICTSVAMRHDNVTVTRARLRWRADYEHWLNKIGHPAGTYGRFPPWRF